MKKGFERFYKSAAWNAARSVYAAKVGGLCECCLAKGIYVPGEIVHHIIPITAENIDDPSITLCFDNLMLLCRECHAARHGSTRRYQIDATGRVIARGE